MSRSRDEYESRLDAASSAHRHDPLRDAAHEVVVAWEAEDNQEKNDLSDRIWSAISRLAGVLVNQKRGDIPVPEVEVTESSLRNAYGDVGSTYERSSLPVVSPERPPEGRRSGAKNVSDQRYQTAFISEARASMGQPSYEDALSLLGQYVKLTFNVDWRPAKGVLTDVVENAGKTHLLLDNYRERVYPLNAIQSIEVLPHEPGDHPSTP